MVRKGKQKASNDPRQAVVGRWLGVPTEFFNVHTDGRRYLARVFQIHDKKSDMVWMRFVQAGYGDTSYAPLQVVEKWVVGDDEVESGD